MLSQASVSHYVHGGSSVSLVPCPLGGGYPGGRVYPPPPPTIKADGTHPTGMLSCCNVYLTKNYSVYVDPTSRYAKIIFVPLHSVYIPKKYFMENIVCCFQDHMGGMPHKKATKSHSVSGTSVTAITTGSGLRKYDF